MQASQQIPYPRWVGYFDLLGTSDRVRKCDSSMFQHIDIMEYAVAEAMRNGSPEMTTKCPIASRWFSDSFMFYSQGGTLQEFSWIHSVCTNFIVLLLMKKIPLRGAIAHGCMYVDETRGIHVGPTLVEAVRWGEKMNWLGLVLAPSAANCLFNYGQISILESCLSYTKLPQEHLCRLMKKNNTTSSDDNNIYASRLKCHQSEFRSYLINVISEMKNDFSLSTTGTPDPEEKYTNTLQFLEHIHFSEHKPVSD